MYSVNISFEDKFAPHEYDFYFKILYRSPLLEGRDLLVELRGVNVVTVLSISYYLHSLHRELLFSFIRERLGVITRL